MPARKSAPTRRVTGASSPARIISRRRASPTRQTRPLHSAAATAAVPSQTDVAPNGTSASLSRRSATTSSQPDAAPNRPAVQSPARSAADFLPPTRSLPALHAAAKTCRGCDLYKNATQTVFGEGPRRALAVFIGEQPGDAEDLAGHPFVGPAGRLLRDLLGLAGIAEEDIYLTNAVKHFKFEPRGKRRKHARPKAHEIRACKPWLDSELAALRPPVVVCLGATAAYSLLGAAFKLTANRGKPVPHPAAAWVMATIHPSALLRIPQHEERVRARAQFVKEMKLVATAIERAKKLR